MPKCRKPTPTPRRFAWGEVIAGQTTDGSVLFAGHDFGGPHLINTGLVGDFGGLIYSALIQGSTPHEHVQDIEFARRCACLHRLLLDAATTRGWRERRALELLMQDDPEAHDGVIRLLCGKAGRHLTPGDVDDAVRLAGLGGPFWIVSRETAMKRHRRANRGRRHA